MREKLLSKAALPRLLALTLTLALLLALTLTLAGCAQSASRGNTPSAGVSGGAPSASGTPGISGASPESGAAAREPALLRALIVDGAETGELVLAGERGVYDIYLLDAASAPVFLDGECADASALRNGMTVEIAVSGDLTAASPAELTGAVESVSAHSLGTPENPGGTAYDLCGLYLQVLEDLWEKDPGLNGGAKYVSVDLSDAPGELSESAKFAVAWAFARRHDAEPLTLGYDELAAQGYLADYGPEDAERKAYYWDDGVLLRITAHKGAEDEVYSLPVLRFDAEKWRSPLGAYFFYDCTAIWPEFGTWSSYTVGAGMIS